MRPPLSRAQTKVQAAKGKKPPRAWTALPAVLLSTLLSPLPSALLVLSSPARALAASPPVSPALHAFAVDVTDDSSPLAAPSYPETRVWASSHFPPAPVGETAPSSPGHHQENRLLYDENASDSPLVGEEGPYYNLHRYYDPMIGRYTTPDAMGLEIGTNVYSYAYNDPINIFDRDGLAPTQGHHYFPRDIWMNKKSPLPLAPDVKKYFDKATTGKIPGGHGWSKAHAAYTAAVRKLWEDFLKKRGKCPGNITLKDAKDFIKTIKRSRARGIRFFLWGIQQVQAGAMSVSALGGFYTSIDAAFRQDPIGTLEMLYEASH